MPKGDLGPLVRVTEEEEVCWAFGNYQEGPIDVIALEKYFLQCAHWDYALFLHWMKETGLSQLPASKKMRFELTQAYKNNTEHCCTNMVNAVYALKACIQKAFSSILTHYEISKSESRKSIETALRNDIEGALEQEGVVLHIHDEDVHTCDFANTLTMRYLEKTTPKMKAHLLKKKLSELSRLAKQDSFFTAQSNAPFYKVGVYDQEQISSLRTSLG
jgi:hypothetical protein